MADPARLIAAVLEIRRSHPVATALEVLDLVLKDVGPVTFARDELEPSSPFGQVIADAFNHGINSKRWIAWTQAAANPVMVGAMQLQWRDRVLPNFCARYGVTVSG